MAGLADIENKAVELLSTEEGRRAFVHLLFEGLSPEAVDILSKRVLTPRITSNKSDDQFKSMIGVPKYTQEEETALEITSLLQFFSYRKRLLENSMTASQVAEMMNVSRQTPHDRVKAGLLLGIPDNNVVKFPLWQFDPDGPNGVVDGLPEVLAALKCSQFAKLSWLACPNDVFDGMKPIEVLKEGRKEEVLHEARAVGVR